MSRLAIIGSRGFVDYALLWRTMETYFLTEGPEGCRWDVTDVISGGAKGADSLAARFAKEAGLSLVEFIPDWEKHGKRAGFLRNEDIVAAADMVLVFWDGVSKGTGNSLSIAKRLKKPTLIVYF